MKIKSITAVTITIVIIFGGIFVTKLTGNWNTTSNKVPRRIAAGELVELNLRVGEQENPNDPAEIRGASSFHDISSYFEISPEELAQAFALDVLGKDPGQFIATDLKLYYGEIPESIGEVGTDSLKWFVSLYLGYNYTPEEESLLPSTAVAFLRDKGLIDDDMIQVLKQKTTNQGISSSFADSEAADHVETSSENQYLIKGNTTFADLYSWGLTKEEIEEATNVEAGLKTAIIRNYYTELGLEFGAMKTVLQDLANSK
ncbi:MAG: hypothetical protein KAQ69_07545 [Spirochaetales bacterium]|nr:hypothetical protein [Spirochaetales bacterium]